MVLFGPSSIVSGFRGYIDSHALECCELYTTEPVHTLKIVKDPVELTVIRTEA